MACVLDLFVATAHFCVKKCDCVECVIIIEKYSAKKYHSDVNGFTLSNLPQIWGKLLIYSL